MNELSIRQETVQSLMDIEYLPSVPLDTLESPHCTKIPFGKLATMGAAFSEFAAPFRTVTQNVNISGDGLYRCVFPKGVTGTLASFKDGSGNLGTIVNNGDFVGQARWIKQDGISGNIVTHIPVNPTMLFMSAALMSVEKKIDKVQETADEILDFLKQDKESKIKGDLKALMDIMTNYKHRLDNAQYISSSHQLVLGIKNDAYRNVVFYKESTNNSINKQSVVDNSSELERNLKDYQMSLYIYALASFLDIMLSQEYNPDYLIKAAKEIDDLSYQYREDYQNCYACIEKRAAASMKKNVLKGIGGFSKLAGKTIEKIPVVSKGPVDEALIAAGTSLNRMGDQHGEQTLKMLRANKSAGIEVFSENINTVNRLYNEPMEILFDGQALYLNQA